MRLDHFLRQRLAHLSRQRIQQGIVNGFILLNGKKTKASQSVRPKDYITCYIPTPPERQDIKAEDMALDIMYEDRHLIVVNKEAGCVVHPAHKNWTGTLLNGLLHHLKEKKEAYPYLVHRLDKDTSGLLLVAKNEEALQGLWTQFYTHSISRQYAALVWGWPEKKTDTLNYALCRSPKDRTKICVTSEPEKGKQAITHYEVMERFSYTSFVGCRLETGRTHQIRAHFKHIGHPLFGDTTYGGDQPVKGPRTKSYMQFLHNAWALLPAQALHAKSLGFQHPLTKEKLFFESPLPKAFETLVEKWRKHAT